MNKHSEVRFAGPSFQERGALTRRERFLAEMERTMPWAKLRALVEPVYANPKNRRGHPLDLDRMLRIHFLQHWYHLSDAAVHEALRDSAAMHAFACVGLAPGRAPGEIEICGFRLLLEEYGLAGAILDAVDQHLRRMGLSVAPGTIVDAALAGARGLVAAPWNASETRQ